MAIHPAGKLQGTTDTSRAAHPTGDTGRSRAAAARRTTLHLQVRLLRVFAVDESARRRHTLLTQRRQHRTTGGRVSRDFTVRRAAAAEEALLAAGTTVAAKHRLRVTVDQYYLAPARLPAV